MPRMRNIPEQRKFFPLIVCIMFIIGTLLIGIPLQLPNTTASSVSHDIGNLKIHGLNDYGSIRLPIQWKGTYQSTIDMSAITYIGLVIDQDNYDHTPGSIDIADCFGTYSYGGQDDFKSDILAHMIIDDGTTQKSTASYLNTGTDDPNDIYINQMGLSVKDKDWFIIQWQLINIKGVDLTGVCIGLELSLSQLGAGIGGGVGGDSGDDVDGFDPGNSVYYVQDDDGTCLGFASAIVSDPITHHYSHDYKSSFDKTFYENETWLYERLHAPNEVVGGAPGNRISTVGWNDVMIPAGSYKNFTLVMAIDDTFDDMITTVEDARHYFNYITTGFRITEFSDSSSGTQQIEVFNHGRGLTDLSGPEFSLSVNSGTLIGSWANNPVPNYEYAVFTRTGGASINAEGDTIQLYENGIVIDEVSFGQEGPVPDPLNGESVARRYDAIASDYIYEWLRNASTGPTWGGPNDIGDITSSPQVVLNRVMFNPKYPEEGYVELMYTDDGTLDISGYRIVCDDEFIVPPGTILWSTNKFYVLTQSNYPLNFDLDDGAANGDNVYLYDNNGNFIDMVGWSSSHTQGEFVSRIPDGSGAHKGYDDITSQSAGWFFDQLPGLIITEFYVNSTSARIELYNLRGGDKVLDSRWNLIVDSGTLTGTYSPNPIPSSGYTTFIMVGGSPGNEGDTIRLLYSGLITDEVSFGIKGVAPDPVVGESTARYWDGSIERYSNDWTREDIPSFGVKNDIPAIDSTPYIILNEVMFNPVVAPEGSFIILINPQSWNVDISNYFIICDDIHQLPRIPPLDPLSTFIINYTHAPTLLQNIDPEGDNVYLYDKDGRLLDMVGWNSPHTQGMDVRRVPDGHGTYQGYDDTTSEAAGWVFDRPLQVLITEISDSESVVSQIEVYNPWFPPINFSESFTFASVSSGVLSGLWSISNADSNEYALFNVTTLDGLDPEGDIIGLFQNGMLIEEISYGQNGPVPDPLINESVERVRGSHYYTDEWSRNMISGPTFGAQNDVLSHILDSSIVLNEVMFNPSALEDGIVELYLKSGASFDISGYKIVGDTEYVIPYGTELTSDYRFFYLTQPTDTTFFAALNPSGDNIYLYDNRGHFLDMVGWSSMHDLDKSMRRIPEGAGTAEGFNDITSEEAGWVFNQVPSYMIVLSEEDQVNWGNPGSFIWYPLNISNLQSSPDYIDVIVESKNGWPVELYEFDQSTLLFDKESPSDGLPDTGLLPPRIPYPIWAKVYIPLSTDAEGEKTRVFAQASINTHWRECALLTTLVNPRVEPNAYIEEPPYPTTIYEKSAGVLGFTNETTITLNATGVSSQKSPVQEVIFILDSSGSMSWNDPDPDGIPGNIPFPKRVQASWDYVDNLTEWERGGYVDFDEWATLKVPLTTDFTYLKQDPANGLWCSDQSGGTIINPALFLANKELVKNGFSNYVKVEILLTDAEDISEEDDFLSRQQADYAAANNIVIFTVGLTIDEPGPPGGIDLLQYIAATTGGLYFSAPNSSAIADIFSQILGMVNNIAGYNPDPGGEEVMVKFVLEDGIEYIDGTFQLVPGTIETDPNPDTVTFNPTNTTLEWNWVTDNIKVGESWSVRFNISSTVLGANVPVNIIPDSCITYMRADGVIVTKEFPLVTINVLPLPFQPKITNVTVEPKGVNITWNPVISAEFYEVYGGPSQTSLNLDLANVLDTVSAPQTWWLDTINPPLLDEYYYVIRAVDMDTTPKTRSRTSNTGGYYTRQFNTGLSTFSLPLEPFGNFDTDWYTSSMNADYIKYMDPNTHTWVQHNLGDGSINNTQMKLGEGFEVKFDNQTTYTFTGMPAAMIMYDDDSGFLGFDHVNEAKNLAVSIDANGDVHLSWQEPSSMNPGDWYEIYYSNTRDGFFGTSGKDYFLACPTVNYGTNSATHINAQADDPGARLYYMVVPFNALGVRGSSTYSIGIWTEEFLSQCDTFGIPLKLSADQTADWYCDNIPNTVGINFYNVSAQWWCWHSTRMTEGAFDPALEMAEGYQISTSSDTKFTFIGV